MLPDADFAHGWLWWSGLTGLGFVVGLIGGLFGVGGGFLLTPLLNALFGIPLNVAVGTGLCQMIGTAVAAFRRHRQLKQGEVKIDWLMMAGSLLGVSLGAQVVAALQAQGSLILAGHSVPLVKIWLSGTYIILLTAIAAWMFHDARVRPASTPLGPGPLTRFPLPPYTTLPDADRRISILLLAYLGLLLGFLSGLLGIGGGVALMPILIYGIGMRIRMAAGTGILLLVVTSLVGTISHAWLGNVHLGLVIALLFGSTLGAPVGASLSARLDGQRLRGLFALLVLLTALTVAWSLFFNNPSPPS